MNDYEAKLKELRFNFRPEEIIDYQTLIALVANLCEDENDYEANKEELFHTAQILVLVYGIEDQLKDIGYKFNINDINTNDLNLWKYLLVQIYNDLESSNDFIINNTTKQTILKVLRVLAGDLNVDMSETQPEVEEAPYQFVEPKFSFDNISPDTNKDDLNELNWDYLPTFIKAKNLLPYKCACCGLEEWQGKPLVLRLSRIKNTPDQSLNNLQFLCPNCYTQIGK